MHQATLPGLRRLKSYFDFLVYSYSNFIQNQHLTIMKKLLILSLTCLIFIGAEAQVAQLSVKKIQTATNQGTTFATPLTMAFNIRYIGAIGGTTDANFEYNSKTYTVDETYAQVVAMVQVVNGAEMLIWGVFDATAGKAVGTFDILDPLSGAAIKLPANARVTQAVYIVETTFVSAGADAGTIALGYPTDGAAAIKVAVAISDGTNPYDAGTFATIPVGTAATWTAKTTAERNLQAVVAVQALTAGKLKIAVKYVVVP